MDFDQMLDAWKAQDERPLYGVNEDLLRLVLQHEQAEVRRTLRREQWMTYVTGSIMAVLAALALWALAIFRRPVLEAAAAALGTATFAAWVGAMWRSQRRQARREREFGNTLREEIRRNLSLIDYRLSLTGRWALMAWHAPIAVGVVLILWFSTAINTDTDPWFNFWLAVVMVITVVASASEASRKSRRELEPRRQRLRELLDALEDGA